MELETKEIPSVTEHASNWYSGIPSDGNGIDLHKEWCNRIFISR